MARPLVLAAAFLVAVTSLAAQDLGRTDRLWREYLSETVRRGLPLVAPWQSDQLVPYWPQLGRARAEAETLEANDDVRLLGAWIDAAEGSRAAAAAGLASSWPRPQLSRFTVGQWGEALFATWDPFASPKEWTQAWLEWTDKVYSPKALVAGIESFEKTDPSAVVPLLDQALRLYPNDRRFLPLVARHPTILNASAGVLERDRVLNGGWSMAMLKSNLTRQPSVRPTLEKAGYSTPALDASVARDYGTWLSGAPPSELVPATGAWWWDADMDGRIDSALGFDTKGPDYWSRRTTEGLWTLVFREGQPSTLVETRAGASWTLRWESYPLASSLEYRWGDQTLIYRFRPLQQAVPLWPAERFAVSPGRLPAALAKLWLPLDPRALASAAASVETWTRGVRRGALALYQGQVWLQVEDNDLNGRDDRWSYYRSGRLVSVYQDVEGEGLTNLRELYRQGMLSQVQAKADGTARNAFVLFPAEGVQLWDPHGDGRPLDRVFAWEGGEVLSAVVLARDELPWETMPPWEPRP